MYPNAHSYKYNIMCQTLSSCLCRKSYDDKDFWLTFLEMKSCPIRDSLSHLVV